MLRCAETLFLLVGINDRFIVGRNAANGQFGEGILHTALINLSLQVMKSLVAEVDLGSSCDPRETAVVHYTQNRIF